MAAVEAGWAKGPRRLPLAAAAALALPKQHCVARIPAAGRAISLLTLFALAIFGIAVLVAVISRSNEEGLDRVYAGIVTALVMGLGFFIFYLLSSEIIMKVISFGVQVFMMMMGGGLQ